MFIPGGAGFLPSYHGELLCFTTIWENMCVLLFPSASKSGKSKSMDFSVELRGLNSHLPCFINVTRQAISHRIHGTGIVNYIPA